MITRFKPAYSLYNFFHKKELEYLIPLYKKYGIQKKYYSPISAEDLKDLPAQKNWLDADNLTEEDIRARAGFESFDENTRTQILNFPEEGFMVLRGLFADRADDINSEIETLWETGVVKMTKTDRIMFAFHQSKLIKSIGEDPELISVLEFLLGKKISLFSSINFFRATQQRAHSDEYHMTTYPHANIIAAWIALEDVDDENGTLFYYPESHKLPYIMNKDFGNEGTKYMLGPKDYVHYENKVAEVIDEHKLQMSTFKAQKGDVLIWHANLLHGGLPVRDLNRTRKSMVFHYYADDAICYHEVTQRPTLFKFRKS